MRVVFVDVAIVVVFLLAFGRASTTGDIPASLGNLTNLERLDLSSSDVWGERVSRRF